ncbi:MAG: DUF11 domain-containing protein, partial [Chloroflexi bacterium]|nr:DUF11 domain-containing protein [Chloroflexota bacterium]
TGLADDTYTVTAYPLNPDCGDWTTSNPMTVTLAPCEHYTDADFGFQPGTGSIGDLVWEDTNGDGDQDNGEPGLENAQVCATNNVITRCTTTDADGYYTITGLPTSTYTVTAYPLNPTCGDWTTRNPLTVTLASCEHYADADFGFQPCDKADLQIVKFDHPDPVCAGNTLTYTLVYTNDGPSDAHKVYITDTLPSIVTFGSVISQPSGWTGPTQTGQTLTWYTPTLPSGASGSIVFTVTTKSNVTRTVTNTAFITSLITYDPNRHNNVSSESTTITRCTYAPNLAPPTSTKSGLPGETVTYTLTLTNDGNCTDSYTVTLIGNSWPTTGTVIVNPFGSERIPFDTKSISPGEIITTVKLSSHQSATVFISVTIPITAHCDDFDTVIISATSITSPTNYDTSTLTTTVDAVCCVNLAPSTAAQSDVPSRTVTYTLWMTNAGNSTFTLPVIASGYTWQPKVTPAAVTLAADKSAPVTITVKIPPDVLAYTSDTVTVTAACFTRYIYLPLLLRGYTSTAADQTQHARSVVWDTPNAGDCQTRASSRLTTTALPTYDVDLAPPTATLCGAPGITATYSLALTNKGNLTETFNLTATVADGQDWPTVVTPVSVTLPAWETTTIMLAVDIPSNATIDQSSTSIVTATISGTNISDTSTLTTTVCPCYPYIITQTKTGPEAREVALDVAGRRAFVAHQNGFTVIDMTTYSVITNVHAAVVIQGDVYDPGNTPSILGPTNLSPAYGIAYDFEHDRIWVTFIAADQVVVFDGQTYARLEDLDTGDEPFTIAYNPTNDRIYVANKNSSTVGVYTYTMALEQTLDEDFNQPVQIDVHTDTNKIYVQNNGNNAQMTVIDGSTITHETYSIATGLLDGFGVAVDTTRNLIYAASAVESKVSLITSTMEITQSIRHVQYVTTTTEVPLYAMEINPKVGSTQESHLYLVAHSENLSVNRFLLVPLGITGWPLTKDLEDKYATQPRSLNLPPFPKNGLVLDPGTDQIWATSVVSEMVSVIQDGVPLCDPTGVFSITNGQ